MDRRGLGSEVGACARPTRKHHARRARDQQDQGATLPRARPAAAPGPTFSRSDCIDLRSVSERREHWDVRGRHAEEA